jgi:hypothetical protein
MDALSDTLRSIHDCTLRAPDGVRRQPHLGSPYDERNPDKEFTLPGLRSQITNRRSEASLLLGQLTVRAKVHVPVSPSVSVSLPVTV